MKTYPLTREGAGRTFAFEFENACISLATVARLLAGVDGVTDVQPRRMFSKSSDVHIEFKYREQPYIVWEPFGDNSRYWVGPKDEASDVGEIEVLEAAFRRYRPLIHRIIGNVSFLRFLAQFPRGKR